MNKVGRPPRYYKSYVKRVDKYLASRKDKSVKVVTQIGGKKSYTMYDTKQVVKLPTIEGFAHYLGVARTSLYNWEKEHKDFAFALENIRSEQLTRLIDEGLAG